MQIWGPRALPSRLPFVRASHSSATSLDVGRDGNGGDSGASGFCLPVCHVPESVGTLAGQYRALGGQWTHWHRTS